MPDQANESSAYPIIMRRNQSRLREGLTARAIPLPVDDSGAPQSLDLEARTVEVVAATENPVQVWDWSHGLIDEVLLMDGLRSIPEQVPLLDTHNAYTITRQLGSFQNIRVEKSELVGLAVYSSKGPGEEAFALVAEGHATDVSVGYAVHQATWIDEGETGVVNGKRYEGPVRVVTDWELFELSNCPIGADPAAKVRAAEPKNKEKKMDERLREYLESRGLAKDATEKQAWEYLAELRRKDSARGHHRESGGEPPESGDAGDGGDEPPDEGEPADDGEGAARSSQEAAAGERARATEILRMCRSVGLDDNQAIELVESDLSADQAGRRILGMMADQSGVRGGAGYRPPARVHQDERDKFRSASIDSLLLRSGIEVAEPAPGHTELRGFTLKELARECLRRAGRRTPGDALIMVGRAFTTSDLPNILMDVANKAVMLGWESAPETWPLWCATGTATDFKPGHEVRLSEFDGLDQLGKDDDEYRYGEFEDASEQYQIATYGKAFRISRRTIINDDLNMLTSIPQAMGEAAARTVGDVAYAALTTNSAMGDGKALFHADHSNLANVTALDETGISTIEQLMLSQKDIKKKRRLRIQPVFFLSPTALKLKSEMFFGSMTIGTQEKPNVKNPYAGAYERIYEPRLDEDNAAVFYLAGPRGGPSRSSFSTACRLPSWTPPRTGTPTAAKPRCASMWAPKQWNGADWPKAPSAANSFDAEIEGRTSPLT